MAWRRLDSLFARLLVLQVLVAIALLLVFGVLVYVERNVAVARLVAERWAPALRQAAGWPGAAPGLPRELRRSDIRPSLTMPSPVILPRMAALQDELRRQGVPLVEALVGPGPGVPVVWLQVRTADGRVRWFGLLDPALVPNVPGRFLIAVVCTALLLAAVSWVFTRRLTRPLEQLRERMQSQRPGETPSLEPPIASASPEIAAIEAAYADLLRRFEAHERERALLLAGVSHDLRSPLARIRLAAGLLPDDEANRGRRESIVRNTQVADRLIESFLDHVRAGELALDQDADLAALARGVASAFAREDLILVLPDTLPLSHTHPLLLERLLANLLDNAFKHGRPPVELRIESPGPGVVIEVSDAGAGLPEAQRETMVRAFARGDAARSTPGTGLGLAIVERVVARMSGTLGFERRGGRHVVRVGLPRRPARGTG
jgi:two-component system osmolarity sensor histidine kinase EnvZ